MRKTRLSGLLAVLLLSGCQTEPTRTITKPGATYAQTQAALDACKIASFREIPQSMAAETSGGFYNPGTVQCSSVGGFTTCNRIGAVNIPASTSTYDVNAGLRDRYIDQCLRAKGFEVLDLPTCSSAEQTKKAKAMKDAGRRPSCAAGPMLAD